MPFITYAPGGPCNVLNNRASTIGATLSVSKAGAIPNAAAVGTPPIPPYTGYPAFGKLGLFADAGEVADCLNQLVARIEYLENFLATNPSYGIVST